MELYTFSYFCSTDHQIYLYTVPSLDPFLIKPIRHVVTFAVDDQHLKRPPPSLSPQGVCLPWNLWIFTSLNELDWLCTLWRNICCIWRSVYVFAFLPFQFIDPSSILQEIPLPHGATLAWRIGRSLGIADQTNYNLVDLELASLFPILPLSQAGEPPSQPRLLPSNSFDTLGF